MAAAIVSAPRLLTLDELFKLPDQRWLIRDTLPLPGLALLYGKSGFGKSFLALDWALSVATGTDWLGKYPVEQGAVVYVACEGASGLNKRAAAWFQHHPDTGGADNVSFMIQSIDLYDEEARQAFFKALEARYPEHPTHDPLTDKYNPGGIPLRLIVLDTLARVYQGEDENSVTEMGTFIEKIETFAKEHSAVVLLVHHTTKTGKSERGSSALRAAMEACFECKGNKKDGQLATVVLKCDKQKDGDELTYKLAVRNYDLPELRRDEAGRVQRSAALEYVENKSEDDDDGDDDEGTSDSSPDLLEVLRQHPKGLTFSEWFTAVGGSNSTFKRRRTELVSTKQVEKRGNQYVATGAKTLKWLPSAAGAKR